MAVVDSLPPTPDSPLKPFAIPPKMALPLPQRSHSVARWREEGTGGAGGSRNPHPSLAPVGVDKGCGSLWVWRWALFWFCELRVLSPDTSPLRGGVWGLHCSEHT